MRKPRDSNVRPRRKGGADAVARRRRPGHDPDAVAFDAIDWEKVEEETIELDPELVERIRARSRLRPLTLRVGIEQIAEARRVAEQTGRKYQAVLRQWLAEGASRARAQRKKGKRGAA
jgi:hypothetical protein